MSRRRLGAGLVALACCAGPAAKARDQPADVPREPEPKARSRAGEAGLFLAGGALGLAAHEAGHLVADLALDTDPYVKAVDFAGIPFFALTYRRPLSRRQEYVVAASGFWVQNGTSEWLLSRRPRLRSEDAPVEKGVLAFHVLTSAAYAGAAFAGAGPPERDTRGMARGLGVAEGWVGALVLAPAVLDSYRYARPGAGWARWTSRGLKVALVLLAFTADPAPRGTREPERARP